ncbi:MAG TPA: hypothetical protein VGO60_18785 [Iamia sp.]|nr:hypothetical protein [Iamia sp.]
MFDVPDLRARLGQLLVGLVLVGIALALIVQADLGLDPWNVFHQGVSERIDIGLGWVVILASIVILLLWIPLRQRPGLGTILNALLVGLSIEAGIAVLPTPSALAPRIAFLAAGILLNGVAIGLYIGAGLGPGPRDGLMTGLAARGHSVRVVRTAIELTALVVGFALGGSVGIGTVLFAVTVGPIVHVTLPRFDRGPAPASIEGTAVVPDLPGAGPG